MNTINAELSDWKLNKLKFSAKNRQGVTFRVNIKISIRYNLPPEILLKTRQKKVEKCISK